MSKHIGTKIFAFLALIIVLQIAFIILAMSGLSKISANNKKTMDIFVEMNVKKGEVGKGISDVRMVGELIVLLNDPVKVQSYAEDLDSEIEILLTAMETVQSLAGQAGDPVLSEDIAKLRASVDESIEIIRKAREIKLGGDQDASYAYLDDNLLPVLADITELQTSCSEEIELKMEEARETLLFTISSVQIFMLVVAVAIVIIIILTVFVITKTVAKPARYASTQMNNIIGKISREEGDLTERIEVKTKDEIGQLAGGINDFLEQLQGIMQKLKGQSQSMLQCAQTTMSRVSESNDNASNVSAAMEELAASMEEVAATIADIATASEEMLSSVQSMNGQAEEGANLVQEIKQRAEEINENTVQSKHTIDNMVKEIRETLESAVEESRSVDKINELTDEILNISSQTNLLALNASIEAARAGEAGKGFAVVADEIRMLAENSKNTANNIQEISQLVTAAVAKLARNAESMLQFIDQKVLTDYDGFVGVAKQYYDDADNMNHILSDFSMYTADIEDTMKNVNEGINGISTTVDESAKGVASAAENAGLLVDAISQIQEEAQNSENISVQLSQEVKRFKNV
ncbi:MAG: methyl-accepting chemotaxis protein [Lachnospiraceae bacterium]|nr:methyl-accepting chemotaxis protein [Lachnospiraceae bacterium]